MTDDAMLSVLVFLNYLHADSALSNLFVAAGSVAFVGWVYRTSRTWLFFCGVAYRALR